MAQQSLELGCAIADITPDVGTALSGFIFRENRPSLRIDDPLRVRVLAARHGAGVIHLLVNYDALGVSQILHEQVLKSLKGALGADFSETACVLTATHAHSAPPTSPLQGENEPDRAYWELLCDRTAQAARRACQSLVPVSLSFASVRIPGLTYNRRALLADGRVSMALEPDALVLERGPVDDTLSLLLWRDARAHNVAALIHFACHGVAMCEQAVTSDIPGHLADRISDMLGVPCLFLQGATGDVNPTAVTTGRDEMLSWLDRCAEHLKGVPERLLPLPCTPFRTATTELPLRYQPLPERTKIMHRITAMERIAQGEIDTPDVEEGIRLLAGIMNFKPGQQPDPAKAAFAARALADAERRRLALLDTDRPPTTCPVRISVWQMGQVAFAFVAAELFAMTGYRIRSLGRRQALLPVTYASPIVGYVPDRAAMAKGGYEVDDAWRFYRQPAPFERDSEERIVDAIAALSAGLER